MTYIIDLTMVTQTIFWIVGSNPRPITRRLIKLAFRAYNESSERNRLHVEIDNYCKEGHKGPNTTFDKILNLIEGSTIKSEEMLTSKQKLELDGLWVKDDEAWDTLSSEI